jgi:hypothetical protein
MGPVSIWCCRWYIGHVDGVGASLGASVDTRIGPFVVLGDVLRLFGGGGLRLRHVVVWREQWRRAKLQLVVLGLLLVSLQSGDGQLLLVASKWPGYMLPLSGRVVMCVIA